MNNIVIAFPKKEVANSIKKILAQSGYTVTAVANTGATAPVCQAHDKKIYNFF